MSALPMIHAQGMEPPPGQVLSAPSSPQGCCSLYVDAQKATSDSQRRPRRSTFSPEAVSLLLPNSPPVSLILTPLEKDGAGVRVARRLRIDMALHSERGVPLCHCPPPQLIAPIQQESLWVDFLHQNETFRGRRTRVERMDEVQRPVGKEI